MFSEKKAELQKKKKEREVPEDIQACSQQSMGLIFEFALKEEIGCKARG